MIMKKLLSLSLLSLLLPLQTMFAEDAVVRGKLPEYKGSGYLMLVNQNLNRIDTIPIKGDGTFDFKFQVEKAGTKMLYLQYLGDNKGVVRFYIKPNVTLYVDITGGMETKTYIDRELTRYCLSPKFEGATKNESEYLNLPAFCDYVCFDEAGKPLSFNNYKEQIRQQQQRLVALLDATAPEFKRDKMKEVEDLPDTWYFNYDRYLGTRGFRAVDDKDFVGYINSIDVNDSICFKRGLVDDCLAFKLQADSSLYGDEPEEARYFCIVRDSINNQKTKALLADGKMKDMMNKGQLANLKRSFEVYCSCSNGGKLFRENESAYKSLSKCLPGMMAIDFEVKDAEGRSYRFLDVIGNGKITYVDFWATWCVPCCAEIPYVEKLVEKYKDNPKVEFISVSIDTQLERWQNKLAKDEPQWRQFIAPKDSRSAITKEYNVRTIPRFMMFDGEGRIITVNAERPSSPNIESIINKAIK